LLFIAFTRLNYVDFCLLLSISLFLLFRLVFAAYGRFQDDKKRIKEPTRSLPPADAVVVVVVEWVGRRLSSSDQRQAHRHVV
jgi:hypothetical protein